MSPASAVPLRRTARPALTPRRPGWHDGPVDLPTPRLAVAISGADPAREELWRRELARLGFDASDGDATVMLIERQGPFAAASPDLPAVYLVDGNERPPTLRGPGAVLSIDAGDEELRAALFAVAAGLTVYGPGLEPHLPAAAEGEAQLTARELDVLRLVARGLPNKAMARELGISENTVKYHLGSIFAKLDAQNRAEAVAVGVRRGLLPL